MNMYQGTIFVRNLFWVSVVGFERFQENVIAKKN